MKYLRLPGSHTGPGRRNTLWLGDDHLLAVDSTGYTEKYARFYFKDIRAVISRRTSRGRIWNGILGSMLAFASFVLIVSAESGDNAAIASFGILWALAALFLAYNVVLGPTCRCHLLMPLGSCDLPSLRRVKRHRGVMERIRPRINQLQGTVRHGEPTVPEHAQSTGPFPDYPKAAAALPEKPESLKSDYGGIAHLLFFALLVADGAMGVINLAVHTASAMIGACIVTIALIASLVAAIAKQHTARVPLPTRRLVWISLALVGSATMVGVIIGPIIQIMNTPAGQIPAAGVTPYLDILYSNPFFAGFVYTYAAIAFVVGGAGLLSMLGSGFGKRPAAKGGAAAAGNPGHIS
jgi:hypothetical protein